MPTYEYHCNACDHEFETQQKMSEAPLKKCPECGKLKLEKLISATAFHLKGGGWYKDLYSSTKPEAASSEASKPATDTKSETKSDTKSEPKSDTKDSKDTKDTKSEPKASADGDSKKKKSPKASKAA
jgi:putative FmdB family regulatory protein